MLKINKLEKENVILINEWIIVNIYIGFFLKGIWVINFVWKE